MRCQSEFPCCTLLLADEDALVLKALTRLLRPLCWQILSAASLEQALAIMTQQRIDVLVCETRFLSRPSLALLRAGKRLHPDIHTVLLSASHDPAHLAQGEHERVVDLCVDKPWDGPELIALIRNAMAASPCGRAG